MGAHRVGAGSQDCSGACAVNDADKRDGVRALAIAAIALFNGFADRFSYLPLSGLESTALLGVAGLAVFFVRKKNEPINMGPPAP